MSVKATETTGSLILCSRAPHYWSFVKRIHRWSVVHRTKCQQCEKRCHFTTSSWQSSLLPTQRYYVLYLSKLKKNMPITFFEFLTRIKLFNQPCIICLGWGCMVDALLPMAYHLLSQHGEVIRCLVKCGRNYLSQYIGVDNGLMSNGVVAETNVFINARTNVFIYLSSMRSCCIHLRSISHESLNVWIPRYV